MRHRIFLALAASALVSIPLSVSATNPTEHFWNDSQGRVVRDGQGNCLRTMFWNAATTRSECGGKMAETPKPAPVPPPAPAPVTPPPAPVPVAPPPAPAPVKAPPKPITLRGDTSFRTGSSVLSNEAHAAVTEVSDQIKKMEKVTAIVVSGHTDSSGSDAANQKLSEARANAVRNALIEDGIDGSLISATGYGESRPIADNATAAGRATNRRVEIQIDGY